MDVFNCSCIEGFYLTPGRWHFYVRNLYASVCWQSEVRLTEMISQHQDSTTVASEIPSHASPRQSIMGALKSAAPITAVESKSINSDRRNSMQNGNGYIKSKARHGKSGSHQIHSPGPKESHRGLRLALPIQSLITQAARSEPWHILCRLRCLNRGPRGPFT